MTDNTKQQIKKLKYVSTCLFLSWEALNIEYQHIYIPLCHMGICDVVRHTNPLLLPKYYLVAPEFPAAQPHA